MSTAVSRAAKELAVLISLEGFDKRGDFDEDKAAARIQSALADLLEKARIAVANARIVPDPEMQGTTDTYSVPLDDIGDLAAVLEPWKAEQITQKPENK